MVSSKEARVRKISVKPISNLKLVLRSLLRIRQAVPDFSLGPCRMTHARVKLRLVSETSQVLDVHRIERYKHTFSAFYTQRARKTTCSVVFHFVFFRIIKVFSEDCVMRKLPELTLHRTYSVNFQFFILLNC